MKKIVVASDSFKGSLSSKDVAQSAARGVHQIYPQCEVVEINVADGGEGTVDAVVEALGGSLITIEVKNPLDLPVNATYGIAGNTAIIEMASASGLPLIAIDERDPSKTSTFGTGEMILDAINRGCDNFLIGIGGSATNDAGTGMLQALGFRFIDSNGNVIERCCGGALIDIADIDDSHVCNKVKSATFTIACDVDTPFCGPIGAAYVFAPQKGASPEMVEALDKGMASFAKVIEQKYGINIVPIAGAGAAGGMGGAFRAFLNATLRSGVEMVLDAIGFNNRIADADLVITGEGKIDFQTPKGKTAAGVLARAKQMGIPTVAIGGCVEPCEELNAMGFDGIYPILEEKVPLEIAMQHDFASANVTNTIARILSTRK